MFSSFKMEEFMKSELSDIFQVKQVVKNMVLGSLGTHFMHMRVNQVIFNISNLDKFIEKYVKIDKDNMYSFKRKIVRLVKCLV